MKDPLPPAVELYRDVLWRREPERRVDNVHDAERFVEEVGFCAALTDSRRPGPSLYTAVCGRRDTHAPRNVQKDPEMNLAWHLKDDLLRRGKVYYAKLARGRATLMAPRLIPYFNCLWGLRKKDQPAKLSTDARAVLKVLRREWETGTADLREAAGLADRKTVTAALDELQRVMLVVPGDVVYEPWFTYIWTLAEGRFPEQLRAKVSREQALIELGRAYLTMAGLTAPGELARFLGVGRKEAGAANHFLVEEGFADRLDTGVYRLADLRSGIGAGQ
jgi:hypothetical protein